MATEIKPTENPINKPPFKIGQTFLIGLGFLSCMFAWGMYNFYLPRILGGHAVEGEFYRIGIFTGDLRLLWTNVIMTLDNIAAILLQPYFGDLSDRLQSKYGRRTPFVIIGILVAAASMLLMPYAVQISSFLGLLLAFIGLVMVFNMGMAFYRAPVVALMPDLTPSVHRSLANVIINIMGGIGSVVGGLIPVIVGGNAAVKASTVGYTTFELQNFLLMDKGVFWGSAIIIVAVLILYLLFVHEKPTGKGFWKVGEESIQFDPDSLERLSEGLSSRRGEKYSTFQEIKMVASAKEKSAWFMFISLFFWTMAADAFSTNYSLWGAEYGMMSDTLLGTINIITSVALMILGFPGALLSNKKGRIWTVRIAIVCFIAAFSGIIVFQEILRHGSRTLGLIGVISCIVIYTFGGSLIGIAAITITWQLAPKNKIGTYTGLYYLFKQLGSIISPIVAGLILSALTPFVGETNSYIGLIPYCLICSIMFWWTFSKVKRGEIGDKWEEIQGETELETQFLDHGANERYKPTEFKKEY